ncbi:MAG TPA: SdpI family protein, partial [Treponemataceae bacterium]|nr:SdpI family protein [Treponemataceae bacterium]
RAYGIVITVISCMFIPLHWLIAAISLGVPVRMDIVIRLLVGAVFLVSGNYMSKFRHNYFCGIRTPWTLASESVWRKTHRRGAVVFIVMGFSWSSGFVFRTGWRELSSVFRGSRGFRT